MTLTLIAVLAGIYNRSGDESVVAVFRILPVTSAIIAGVIPIVFFGNPRRGRRSSWRV